MSPRTKKQFEEIRKEKKSIIAETALRLFSEKGYHATTISEIAKKAKISKGLLYNYFDSKEKLLAEILQNFIIQMETLINPNMDDEITNAELESFFEMMIESMKTNREHWRILFQLTMQKGVISYIFSKNDIGNSAEKLMKLGYKYFADRFDNPQEELLLFRSVLKGLALIIVYTPEACPDDVLESFKKRLKDIFIKPKKTQK